MDKKYKELLVIVHPNWLNHAIIFGMEGPMARRLMQGLYSKGKRRETDFRRYRKAMFDIYGRAILEAAKKDDVLVAILVVPMELSEYKAIVRKKRDVVKEAEHADVLRFINFARERLGERLIVINSLLLGDLISDARRLSNIIARKRIRFTKDFVIRGGGELSDGCVRTIVDNLGALLRPKKAYVDRSICGDVISNFPKRRVVRHTQRAKPSKRKAKPVVRRASLRRLCAKITATHSYPDKD